MDKPNRIWIDLSNSPHPVLFEPIVEELRRAGRDVLITAREHAQTLEIARQRWPDVRVIGGRSPRGRAAKARTIATRALQLTEFARREKVDVAVSHNSYAQTIAARAAGVPCVTAMDYEYQPANHIAFRFARRVLVPADFPARTLRAEGARGAKVWRYQGFKEEVYLYGFRPDPSVLDQLGLAQDERFFIARPSPAGAAYHQFENPLFARAVHHVARTERVRVVFLPRGPKDLQTYADIPSARKVIPSQAVDTRSLLYYAAGLLGAGGTMNREAALLGTPVFGLYVGRLAALDRRLVREGRIHSLTEEPDALEAKLADAVEATRRPRTPVLTRHVRDRFLEALLTPFDKHRLVEAARPRRGFHAPHESRG